MKKKIIFAAVLLLFGYKLLEAQKVKQVRAEVREGRIHITYILSGGSFNDLFRVALFVSRDSGRTFTGPMKEVTGDIGDSICKGDHAIEWNALKEMPFLEESLVFDVRAEHIRIPLEKKIFVEYVGNGITYLGIRAGTLGKIGFYGEIRANTKAFTGSDYVYKNSIVQDYTQPGYYSYTGSNFYSAFSLLGGVTWQPWRNLIIYGGAGYGKQNYLVQFDEFLYSNDTKTGTAYAKYDGYCYSGVEVDAGLMYRIRWFLISAGGTTINFGTFGWTAGIGIAF